jgi:ParB family chromosome partitioning protein
MGTKVRIHGSSKKGRIEIEYFSQEDLERLIDVLTKHIV